MPGLDKAEHVWREYRKLKTTIHEHASRNDDGKYFFRVKNGRYWLALSYSRHKKVDSRRNALAPKKAQLIPYTVVLYEKGGTIKLADCQLPGDRLRWLNKEP